MSKYKDYSLQALRNRIDDLNVQITPGAGIGDVDVNIGEDQLLEKKNIVKLIEKEIEKRLKK